MRRSVDEEGNKFEYMKVQGDESGKPKTTRRQLNEDGNGYKHYPRPVPGTDKVNSVRTAAVFHGEGAYEYEYELDSEASKPNGTQKANGRRNRVRNDEGEECEDEYEYDPERNKLGKERIEVTNDHVLEPIVIASKILKKSHLMGERRAKQESGQKMAATITEAKA